MFNLFSRKKGHAAHMGDENQFYFNEELNRWVERGKENEVTQETLPPPPVASTSATTQKVRDRADPASRYVVAGGFGRSSTPPTDAVKSFATPPKLTSTPPLSGGFFVPSNVQTTSEATTEIATQDSAKYKGFRIPKFEKPDEVNGTQEEYEASEIQKWKAKIDRREARKNNDGKSDSTHENGISHLQKTGSGKLEDNWLFDSPGDSAFDSQPFQPTEEKTQLNGVDQTEATTAFETLPQMVEPLKNEGDPVDLFAVDSETTPQVGHTFDQPAMQMQNQMPYLPQTEAAEWFSSEQQQEGFDDEPVDFDTWGNPEENEQLAETLQSQQEIPQPESTTEAQNTNTQEQTYVQPEYPGAVRETDDPYDIAWLLHSGLTDPDQCHALTVYMCQLYQDTWRSWHKDDPHWDAFWTWYYDAGYDIIHSGHNQQQNNDQDYQGSYQGTDFFDLGMEHEFPEQQFNGHQIRPYLDQDSQETPSSMSQHLETVPEEPEGASNEEETSEQFVPESDDEIWKIPENEATDHPEEPVQSPIAANAVPDVDFEQAESPEILKQEPLISCPVSSRKESATKLSPWEDEFLFSLPDPFVDSPSSEDGTDDGKLPFAIFNHNGMLQFLMKLSSFLTELLQNNHADMSPATNHLQYQIRDLIRAVEMSGNHSLKPVNLEQTEILKQELEVKTQELESLRYRLSQEEVEWQNKMDTARQEATQMQEAMTSMEDCLQQQEGRMHELVTQLSQTESELKSNKQQLMDLRAQLDNKDDQMRDLMGNFADEKVKLEALRDQFKMEGGNNVIPRQTPEEVENLRQEIESLQAKLAERSELPVNGVTASEVNSELEARVMSLQKELLQQQTALEVKEVEIEQLRTASETGNGFSVNNNETGEFLERLKEMEAEIDVTKQLLLAKDSQITELQKSLELKSRELEALSFIGVNTTEKESDSDLASELEMMERKFTRLEQDLHDKDADFQRLSVMLESLHKKDAVISKLTAVLGEKDQELLQARASIHEGRHREATLIESISAKDIDLENVVRSLLFSQKQVSRLSEYCGQLGGDAHQLLSTLQVVE